MEDRSKRVYYVMYLLDPPPVPDCFGQQAGEEEGLEPQPDLGESSVLVDGDEVEVDELAQVVVLYSDLRPLVGRVEGGRKADVEQVVVVVEGTKLEEAQGGAVVVVAVDERELLSTTTGNATFTAAATTAAVVASVVINIDVAFAAAATLVLLRQQKKC